MYKIPAILILVFFTGIKKPATSTWIRINLLGYQPRGSKVAVLCSKERTPLLSQWQLVSADTRAIVFKGNSGSAFGDYGPFTQTYRLDFSRFTKTGRYYLQCGYITSPVFEIGDDVYRETADYCLRYMRQQRSGFNPFLRDSCHTHDGYTLYGENAGIKDSTYIDVSGGWHDATDYLQYSSTSANATYHLLMAYRDFPWLFRDLYQANGVEGRNGILDVLDEAKWGLDWLLKMHPQKDWMFNQLADDRDHINMRLPKEDSQYGKGYQRPVYFVSGEPQQRGKFMNNTTGTSSIAGKFSSSFSLGYTVFNPINKEYAGKLYEKAFTAISFGEKKPGVSQTASVKSPYIYAEDNWVDDMELAYASLAHAQVQRNNAQKSMSIQSAKECLERSFQFAKREKVTPWLGNDSAKHYQWYPFINLGHYELAKELKGKQRDSVISYYKQGIQRVWSKARKNAFYRGVPFIWCSNNLTTSFAIQCYWYRHLTNDMTYRQLEQANFDWLFGCNPWGTSMVYGLPSSGDTPVDPHSSFTHIGGYPIDGALVDGPVYGITFKNQLGIELHNTDEYAAFQSDLAVYHDDFGDYSTNEPTMDGTASLIYLLAAEAAEATKERKVITGASAGFLRDHGAIIRGDSTKKMIALTFTGDEFGDGGPAILKTLQQNKIKASFFLTGNFYRNPSFKNIIRQLKKYGHYTGSHSDQHLLYCDWRQRDSLLVNKEQFTSDLLQSYQELKKSGVGKSDATYFLPPYEWYNDSISAWTSEMGLQLINYTPGTGSMADYTFPGEANYRSSEEIYQSILAYEKSHPAGLNGFILLMHIGTDARRTNKFYDHLARLIHFLKSKKYSFCTVKGLLDK